MLQNAIEFTKLTRALGAVQSIDGGTHQSTCT